MKLLILFALLGGSGVLAIHAWLRKRGRDPLGPRPAGELPDTALALVFALIVWLLAQVFVPVFPSETTLGPFSGRTVTMLVVTVTHVVIAFAVLIPALAGTLRPRISVGRRIAAGVLAAIAVIALQIVYGLVMETVYSWLELKLPVQDIVDESRTAAGLDLVVRVVSAVALAPFAEEVFYRGILLPAASRVAGPALGLLLQAVVFGLIHCVNQWEAWPLTIPLAALGWIAGLIYLRTGSLLVPVVLHATFNAFNFAVLRMSEPVPPA
jgi:membrane protease YdiL (CAAX protease family)